MEILKFVRVQWDRSVAVVAALVGAIALLVGYIGVSGTPHVAYQLPYFISGGLFGIFALGVAAVAWLSADLRDEWRELRGLRQLLDEDLRSRGLVADDLDLVTGGGRPEAFSPYAGEETLPDADDDVPADTLDTTPRRGRRSVRAGSGS